MTVHIGHCHRPGCGADTMPWLDTRYCSIRCRTLDLKPSKASRDAYFSGDLTRTEFVAAHNGTSSPMRRLLRPVRSRWPR